MPLQNRVTPLGELIADPARGLVYGNRGCLHDEHGRIRRRFNGRRWIACRLEFRGWHRSPLMQPGRFTELFFLVVKPVNAMIDRFKHEPEPDPTIKVCPHCLSTIPTEARVCAYCTRDVGAAPAMA